jgi:hypothetical protein
MCMMYITQLHRPLRYTQTSTYSGEGACKDQVTINLHIHFPVVLNELAEEVLCDEEGNVANE